MQILSTAPLVEKFRRGTFKDDEIGAYFLAAMIFAAVFCLLPSGEWTRWDFLEALADIAITVLGIHYLKSNNGNTFGNDFLNKYFALGWVVGVRVSLFAIPAWVVIYATLSIMGGHRLPEALGTIFSITISLLFYRWLGAEFVRAQRTGDSTGLS